MSVSGAGCTERLCLLDRREEHFFGLRMAVSPWSTAQQPGYKRSRKIQRIDRFTARCPDAIDSTIPYKLTVSQNLYFHRDSMV